jgi:HEPN domain-containing protein
MSDARQAISVAREAGASEHAPDDLRAAEDSLDSALRSLSKKEYELARVDAIEAKNQALKALEITESSTADEPQR